MSHGKLKKRIMESHGMAVDIQPKIKQSNKLQQSTEPIQVSGRIVVCPHCKKENPYSVIFCDYCKKPIGRKFDEDKVDWTLFPWKAGAAIVRIMMFGAKKYARNNWKHVQPGERYLAAAIRHIGTWLEGEAKDSETGFSHLWHAGCCLIFAIWLEIEGKIKCSND